MTEYVPSLHLAVAPAGARAAGRREAALECRGGDVPGGGASHSATPRWWAQALERLLP